MTKNDYIEKITQNLEHLTKDELKDVATLTNAQFEVRLKVAEKEYWGKEIANLKSQLQQQALPVVPECVGKYIEDCKKEGDCLFGVFADATRVEHDMPDLVYFWLGDEGNNDELFARAWLDGYQVEKQQLFRLKLKNTPISNYYLWLNHATGKVFVDKKFLDWTNHDNVKNIFTEQEIAKISDGAFVNNKAFELVPVEDGE